MQLLVGLLVGQLLPSFYIVWYDLPTNSPTSDPTNNRTNWIWMSKKIGLYSVFFRLNTDTDTSVFENHTGY